MALVQVNWRPTARQLRGFGLGSAVAFAAFGAWLLATGRLFGADLSATTAGVTGWTLVGLAVFSAAGALAAPTCLRPLYLLLTAGTLPIGWVVSHVVLAAVFYGLITPLALLFRLIGRDPLGRRFDPAAKTYWTRRRQVTDVKRYFRQF